MGALTQSLSDRNGCLAIQPRRIWPTNQAAERKRQPPNYGGKLATTVVTRGVLARKGGPVLTDKPRTTRLRDHPLTRDLGPLDLETLAGRSRGCTYSVSEHLWRQGAKADFFFLICSGQVALEIAILQEGALQIEKVGGGSSGLVPDVPVLAMECGREGEPAGARAAGGRGSSLDRNANRTPGFAKTGWRSWPW